MLFGDQDSLITMYVGDQDSLITMYVGDYEVHSAEAGLHQRVPRLPSVSQLVQMTE